MGKTKVKVTVTLAPDIVSALDEKARENNSGSRSAALEAVLRDWQYARALQKLEEETAAYYDSLTEEQKRKDAEWAEFAGRAAAEVWPKE
jgi:hypothetical protein